MSKPRRMLRERRGDCGGGECCSECGGRRHGGEHHGSERGGGESWNTDTAQPSEGSPQASAMAWLTQSEEAEESETFAAFKRASTSFFSAASFSGFAEIAGAMGVATAKEEPKGSHGEDDLLQSSPERSAAEKTASAAIALQAAQRGKSARALVNEEKEAIAQEEAFKAEAAAAAAALEVEEAAAKAAKQAAEAKAAEEAKAAQRPRRRRRRRPQSRQKQRRLRRQRLRDGVQRTSAMSVKQRMSSFETNSPLSSP